MKSIRNFVFVFFVAVSLGAADHRDVVLAGFDDLLAYIETIPDAELNRGNRNAFSQRVSNARRLFEQGQVCAAADILQAHLNQAQAFRKAKSIAAAETLYNMGRSLRTEVLSFAAPPSPCVDPAVGRPPQVDVIASDNRRFAARVSFGTPSFSTVEAGGETWTHVSLPGIENAIGPSGRPAVPSWQALIGVPRGASAGLLLPAVQVARETVRLNLYPYQDVAADQSNARFVDEPMPPRETFSDPPFVKNQKAYETSGFVPPSPCAVRIIDQYRDLTVAQIQCNAGQYDPVSDELKLFDSVQFEIGFDGGDGTFITTQTLSPFETGSSTIASSVINSTAVTSYVKDLDLSPRICFGEELLVLTHPNFRAAADDLVQWKRDKGISTSIFEVGAGTSLATGAAIDAFIENRYDSCIVRPSYVLLVGDSEFVPPARTNYDSSMATCSNCGDTTTGSDWGYATYSKSFFGFLPWFSVGRIPVDTAAEAQTVVDKTIQYESTPPFLGFFSGAPFYTTSSNASYFQCCRTPGGLAGRDMRSFVQTSELARNTLMGAGYTVERIYNTDTGYAQDPVADATPRRWFDGSALPADLAPGSGFGWNGNTQDIIDAFNDGRFLILHRDHGGSTSWGDPSFSTGNFGSLTNGALLPFVFSVNCASGFWDRETDSGSTNESFMEQLLMLSGGGMVAGLGDNRNSPTWENSALTRGFYDAIWPNVAPGFGSNVSRRRLGDILDHGKIYLLTEIGVAQPAGDIVLERVVGEWIMWHAFGDPTIEMWTANPHRISLPLDYVVFLEQDQIHVAYSADGATITALQLTKDGYVPIARGVVENGVARLPFTVPPEPVAPILFSASKENAVSVLLTRGRLPDLVVDSLALTSSNLIIGQDLAGNLTVKVGNIGGANAPGTLNPDGTVKGAGIGYMVDLVISSDMVVPAGFASVPLPAGVAWVEDGLLQGGRVSRTPDVGAGVHLDLPTVPPISSDVGGVVPLQAPAGDMFLCARIDPGDTVVESDETNNVTCVRVKLIRD